MAEMINGVDTEAIGEVATAIGGNPELAKVSFSVRSDWDGGFRGKSKTSAMCQAGAEVKRDVSFDFASDEPPALLGQDSAASAGEYALQALAACYAVTFAANASVQGIELSSLHLDLEGDFDLHGFLGLDENIRPGMQSLNVKVRIESPDATPGQLRDLVRTVEERSPIRDTLANPVPVTTELVD